MPLLAGLAGLVGGQLFKGPMQPFSGVPGGQLTAEEQQKFLPLLAGLAGSVLGGLFKGQDPTGSALAPIPGMGATAPMTDEQLKSWQANLLYAGATILPTIFAAVRGKGPEAPGMGAPYPYAPMSDEQAKGLAALMTYVGSVLPSVIGFISKAPAQPGFIMPPGIALDDPTKAGGWYGPAAATVGAIVASVVDALRKGQAPTGVDVPSWPGSPWASPPFVSPTNMQPGVSDQAMKDWLHAITEAIRSGSNVFDAWRQ